MTLNQTYHATFDVNFKPRVRHVPAHEPYQEFFRLELNPEFTINLSRAQMAALYDAILIGYVSEIPFLRPVKARVVMPSPETDIEEGRR